MNKIQNLGGITGTGVGAYFQPEAISFFTRLYRDLVPGWTVDELQLPIKLSAVLIAIGVAYLFARIGYVFDKKQES